MIEFDSIKRKIAIIEDQEIRDDIENLPSDYSQNNLPHTKSRKRNYDDSHSDSSRLSAGKYGRKKRRLSKASMESSPAPRSKGRTSRKSISKTSDNNHTNRPSSLIKKHQETASQKRIIQTKDFDNSEIHPIREVEDENRNMETLESRASAKRKTSSRAIRRDKMLLGDEEPNITSKIGEQPMEIDGSDDENSNKSNEIEDKISHKPDRSMKSKFMIEEPNDTPHVNKMSRMASLPFNKNQREEEKSKMQPKLVDKPVRVYSKDDITSKPEAIEKLDRSKFSPTKSPESETPLKVVEESKKLLTDRSKPADHNEHNIDSTHSEETKKPVPLRNINQSRRKKTHKEEIKTDPRSQEQQEDDEDMECEGGQQEEEEQSESSDNESDPQNNLENDNQNYSKGSRTSYLEGEESEDEDKHINLNTPKQLISIKDIDKEFWRQLQAPKQNIDQINLELAQIRESIKENCKIVSEEANEQIKNIYKKTELDLKEQNIYIKTLQSDIEITSKKIKRERTDFTLENQSLNKKVNEIQKKHEYVLSSIKTLAILLASILEGMNIDQAMQEQDEIDKRGISLMGVRRDEKINDSVETLDLNPSGGLKADSSMGNVGFGSPQQKSKANISTYSKRRFTNMLNISKEINEVTGAENASISMKKQCLSCSGNSSVALNAFKMACLAYSPSTVGYRGQVFPREFLLALKQQIIQSYWSVCFNKPPFTENNEINVDLIYENSIYALTNNNQSVQTMKMRDSAILMEDNEVQVTRRESRNKILSNIVSPDTTLPKNNYQTSSTFLSPVIPQDSPKLDLPQSNFQTSRLRKSEHQK